jgi:diphosphomevalonate decarboxylase
MTTATAQASPNIAFIKYWGNREDILRLPSNGSISMNLDGLYTRTTVSFQPSLPFDELIINGREVTGPGLDRISYILDIIRGMANIPDRAEVMSENNFPSGAGIASSASAFAALALAGSTAAGLELSEPELSTGTARVWFRVVNPRRICGVAGRHQRRSLICFLDCRTRSLGFGGLCCCRQRGT